MFKLHYHVSNGGDGSANVWFHRSNEEAEKADEDMEEGWGECSARDCVLKIEDGKLFYREYAETPEGYKYLWFPCEEVQDG